MIDWFLNLQAIHRKRETCPSNLKISKHKEVQNRNGHEPVEQNRANKISHENKLEIKD